MPDAMAPEDVTHRDLWVQLATLTQKIDGIHALLAERKEDHDRTRKDVDGLFDRVRRVESRQAQIAILGTVAVVVIPCLATLATMFQLRLAIPAAIERQEVGR